MGRPIERTFGQENTILKFFDYKGAACVVAESGVVADATGHKIVKAGTPYPTNDASCLGYLLHDVDVTNGDAPATYIYEGIIDPAKIDESVVISAAAKSATPKVTFYGTAYAVAE